MKKIFFFLSAIALLGLTAACNEEMPVNPNFNAERGEVKTSFIINVATEAQTKASAEDVQQGTAFRGMQSIKLFMSKGYGTTYLAAPYQYDLGVLSPVYGDANLTQEGAINADKSRRVYNLTIPTGVDNMTFYAQAKEANASQAGTAAAAKSNNKIKYTVDADKTKTNFQLVPIIEQAAAGQADGTAGATQTDAVFGGTNATALLEILNSFQQIAADWKALDNVELLTAYDNYFTTNETLRQGSGPAVLRTMQDMYNIAVKYAPVDAANANTESPEYKVCQKIIAAIEQSFTASGTNGSNYTLTYQTAALLQFPFEEFGLPAGAAQVKCTTPAQGAPTFAWVNPSNTMDANTVDYKDIMFPAELCYWADSPLRISNLEGADTDPNYYPVNWAKWNDNNQWNPNFGWLDYTIADNRVVTKETRAVALHNNVLYGNALAQATVKMGATTYKDNRKALVPHVSDQDIEIDGSKKYFKVTGILIGGQPKQVEWNFVPGAQAERTAVIYDHAFADNKITTEASAPFYTMVFDNLIDGDTQETVYFALELENHAGDFYGKDNIIYDGGKFYLVGSMKLTDAQITALKAADSDYGKLAALGYRIPPVTVSEGTTTMNLVPRVFMQDFTTKMNVTLGPNALKLAYATVPDLRPTQMFFGLSVDLTWKAGASFDVEIGKAN